MPSAQLTADRLFRKCFSGSEARAHVRREFGIDIGFTPGDEAFSAMLALSVLPRQCLSPTAVDTLVRQVESSRWHNRFRFFPGVGQFAADTDCTAHATSGLAAYDAIPRRQLHAIVQELAGATASHVQNSAGEGHRHDPHTGVIMVYWDDDAEPGAPPRGRKYDPVVCANALHAMNLAQPPAISRDFCRVMTATLNHVRGHLVSGRYLRGTRYYPSPDAFLHAASHLCLNAITPTPPLLEALRGAFVRREASLTAQEVTDPLQLALRIITADNLAIAHTQDERRATLARHQRDDGSWPARTYYRFGRVPLYFGSPQLSTLFAVKALRPADPPRLTSAAHPVDRTDAPSTISGELQ
ncbi:hypothetical protein [Streptomyces sp. NPDC057623]|uniref:hypothetical protein n=1 Tax=Streptomyces sp. NPDC057623 TaxID=3346187 RepID=UPI0036CD72CC